MITATYSPEDNKLRLYSYHAGIVTRLDPVTYARVRAAGFIYAPKQELFVAPAWTPERADLAAELADSREIDDEDTSLVDRAEERAERFEDYSEKRAEDATRAHEAVTRIADGIPLGQPILVGHHSEKHARKDAERIENGMRKAIKAFETSQYWEQRAKGAIRHAKYKERPDVRARRIKGLEADLRKQQKTIKEANFDIELWTRVTDPERFPVKRKDGVPMTALDCARWLANRCWVHVAPQADGTGYWTACAVLQPDGERYRACPSMTVEAVQAAAIAARSAVKAHAERWVAHLEGRLLYERTMLADAGGTVADKAKAGGSLEPGGACRCWCSPGYGKGWSYIQKVNKVSVTVLDNWGNSGPNFKRTVPMDSLKGIMSADEVAQARAEGRLMEDEAKTGFYLTAATAAKEIEA